MPPTKYNISPSHYSLRVTLALSRRECCANRLAYLDVVIIAFALGAMGGLGYHDEECVLILPRVRLHTLDEYLS